MAELRKETSPGIQLHTAQQELDYSMIPETIIQLYNGPMPGFINIATAQRDFPWFNSSGVVYQWAGELSAANRSDQSAVPDSR